MAEKCFYSPAEICDIFGISKSTLFRWEDELPPVTRDLHNQRQYTQQHIRAISEKQRKQLAIQLKEAAHKDLAVGALEIAEALSLRKFLQGNMTGLYELAEYPQLSPRTIHQLVRTAMEQRDPSEPAFYDILEVVVEQGRKLHRQTREGGEPTGRT